MERGLYYYKMMLFDLKNVGTIYQCLVIKIFEQQIDHNMEVYIDDMLVKIIEAIGILPSKRSLRGASKISNEAQS